LKNNSEEIRKLTLPNGSQVGILNLESILSEVAGLKLADDAAIRKALLDRVKASNYVASGAEADYSAALFNEYRKR